MTNEELSKKIDALHKLINMEMRVREESCKQNALKIDIILYRLKTAGLNIEIDDLLTKNDE